MERIADLIDRWNVFMPLLPVSLDADLLWIALPLALVALLLLGIYARSRRIARLVVAPAAPRTAPEAAGSVDPRIPNRLLPLLRSLRPRAPSAPIRVAPPA